MRLALAATLLLVAAPLAGCAFPLAARLPAHCLRATISASPSTALSGENVTLFAHAENCGASDERLSVGECHGPLALSVERDGRLWGLGHGSARDPEYNYFCFEIQVAAAGPTLRSRETMDRVFVWNGTFVARGTTGSGSAHAVYSPAKPGTYVVRLHVSNDAARGNVNASAEARVTIATELAQVVPGLAQGECVDGSIGADSDTFRSGEVAHVRATVVNCGAHPIELRSVCGLPPVTGRVATWLLANGSALDPSSAQCPVGQPDGASLTLAPGVSRDFAFTWNESFAAHPEGVDVGTPSRFLRAAPGAYALTVAVATTRGSLWSANGGLRLLDADGQAVDLPCGAVDLTGPSRVTPGTRAAFHATIVNCGATTLRLAEQACALGAVAMRLARDDSAWALPDEAGPGFPQPGACPPGITGAYREGVPPGASTGAQAWWNGTLLESHEVRAAPAGAYHLTASVLDQSGNVWSASRVVEVAAAG